MQEANRQKQRELYGAPLADIAARITAALGLTQGRLAAVMGVSAPMLSQLLSGHRTKLGNPAAVTRLAALNDLADVASSLTRGELEARLASIQESHVTLTATPVPGEVVAELRRLADPAELSRLAALTTSAPLAEALNAAARSHG